MSALAKDDGDTVAASRTTDEAFAAVVASGRPLLVLVTGSRDWTDAEAVRRELCRLPPGSIILHGNARGADQLAGQVAADLGFDVRPRPAEWERYGKAAGIIRNREMLAEGPDVVIAFHPDLKKARGTKHMVRIARKAGVPVCLANT